MVDTIDRCAAAIAEVRERYEIRFRTHDNDHDVWSAGDSDHYLMFTDTRAECQAFIDREAARACVAELKIMSDGMVDAGDYSNSHSRKKFSDGFTAAITAVLEGKA